MTARTIYALRSRVTGPVITPGTLAMTRARKVYNFMIDRHPAAVVRCAGEADVAAVVRHAAEPGMDLVVRGGAHCVPGFGTADDGLPLRNEAVSRGNLPVMKVRRGHYELATDATTLDRVAVAFTELALAI